MTPSATDIGTLFNAALECVDRPLMREWSVKAQAERLIEGRFLISFGREAMGPGPSRVMRGICHKLGAPPAGLAKLDVVQSRADSVHFGYEPDPGGDIFKCYLEFQPGKTPDKCLIFLALKWRQNGTWMISCYHERTELDKAARTALVADILPTGTAEARAMTELAVRDDRPVLLEVSEPGNPRRSLDVNLADANLTLEGQRATVLQLLGKPAVDGNFMARHGHERLGHVAAGTARDGRPFGTVYYGAHRVDGPL